MSKAVKKTHMPASKLPPATVAKNKRLDILISKLKSDEIEWLLSPVPTQYDDKIRAHLIPGPRARVITSQVQGKFAMKLSRRERCREDALVDLLSTGILNKSLGHPPSIWHLTVPPKTQRKAYKEHQAMVKAHFDYEARYIPANGRVVNLTRLGEDIVNRLRQLGY